MTASSGKILLLSQDFNIGSQVSGTAKRADRPCQTVLSLKSLLENLSDAETIVLDLNHPQADAQQVINALREQEHSAEVIAFGPHVHEQKLAAAQQAGCTRVLARGAFLGQINQLLG